MSRPESEVHNLLDKCSEISNGEDGSKYPGMSYEEGIQAAIEWMNGDGENPLEDE